MKTTQVYKDNRCSSSDSKLVPSEHKLQALSLNRRFGRPKYFAIFSTPDEIFILRDLNLFVY
jgi:hypothetical protein